MDAIFPPTSRYALTPTATFVRADGTPLTYLKRRFVPAPESLALLQWHRVLQNERLDNIAAQYLGDPEQFWRLCDANRALRPQELTETVGKPLRITLPEGIPGVPHA
ncbi:MAG: LysM domain-containing protein [Xanthomonadaceae bacterium]|nr:LysM domain-containing protein [Xanthomonadaceae bacterium]